MKAIHTPTGQVVEAVQWTGGSFKDIWDLTNGQVYKQGHKHLILRVNGGSWAVDKGEYVTKMESGELYVCTEKYFESFFKVECDSVTDEIPMK